MTIITTDITTLPDRALLEEVRQLAAHERRATVALIAALMELDGRRLYLGEGYSSLFTYCTQGLHLSEHAAYSRIEAARAGRRFPAILPLLECGALTLTTVCLLARHLTVENQAEVLERARGRSKRDVELLLAELQPQPAVPASIRKLPAPKAPQPPTRVCEFAGDTRPRPPLQLSPPAPPAVVRPLAPERYKLQFTVSRDTHDKLHLRDTPGTGRGFLLSINPTRGSHHASTAG